MLHASKTLCQATLHVVGKLNPSRRLPRGPILGSLRLGILAFLLASGRGIVAEGASPFAFGLVADVQYADKDPGGTRHYRVSEGKLRAAVSAFNGRELGFVVELGDFIDGHPDRERSARDLEAMVGITRDLKAPLHHVLGNHGYKQVAEFLGGETHGEFTSPGAPGWRFVTVDGNDAGKAKIGGAQVKWFGEVLDRAAVAGEKVIALCHYPLLAEITAHRLENPEGLLDAMDRAGCVVAWFNGHDHRGGYGFRNGVHHVGLAGMIETPDTASWAVVEIHDDRLHEIGYGREPSRVLPFGAAMPSAPASKGAR